MLSKYTYKKTTWIDLESPTKAEIVHLMEEYGISPVIGEELLVPTLRSKVELFDNVIFLVLHFPHIDEHKKHNPEQEIDFIIGHDFLITARSEMIHGMHDFSRFFETSAILDKHQFGGHAGFLFYNMIKALYVHAGDELEEINIGLKKIERQIFEGKEDKMVLELSKANRQWLDFRQATRFHKTVLESFEIAAPHIFGEGFKYHSHSILAEWQKIDSALTTYREILTELRLTNDSLLSSKTNETMKKLMMMSFVVFPLSLIAGVFGMNAVHLPFVGMPHDFIYIVALMIVSTLIMILYFHHKKWI